MIDKHVPRQFHLGMISINNRLISLSRPPFSSLLDVELDVELLPLLTVYHPQPYKIPPRPFAYAYGVADDYAGTNFDKKETQDEYGVVQGQYRVALPDGRTQIVTYHADHENGYVADVKYEGQPHYDPAPYHKPKYHPAPVHAKSHGPSPFLLKI